MVTFWLRAKFNGEPDWRYYLVNDHTASGLTVEIDPAFMPKINSAPFVTALPFSGEWRYNIDGFMGANDQKMLAVSNLIDRSDMGIPILSEMKVYQPDNLAVSRYKIKVIGKNENANGYDYYMERFFDFIPANLETPDFDISKVLATENRVCNIHCTGDFDGLVFTRTVAGKNITWQGYYPAANGADIRYVLPDLPSEISQLSKDLAQYNFGNKVKVRAERYNLLFNFNEIQDQIFQGNNANWQAESVLLGVEREF